MNPFLDLILVGVLLLNFVMLGASRLSTVITMAALQGGLLGVLLLVAHHGVTARVLLMAATIVVLKVIVIPRMLFHAIREVMIRREVEFIISPIASLLLGALGTAMAVLFAKSLPLAPEHAGSLIVPASLSTVLVGFLILTTRVKAITQVVGYLVLENGIFIFGLLLVEAMPFLVEIGVLLDLFVAIFIMGIVIHRISREFSTVSTYQLSALKE